MTLTIGVVGSGAMGAAVGRQLVRHGAIVLTALAGRSSASKARAAAAGMQPCEDDEMATRAAFILSIVPPAEALAVGERFADILSGSSQRTLYVDCNAIAIETVHKLALRYRLGDTPFVDGAIFGYPPTGAGAGPAFYFSGPGSEVLLQLNDYGIHAKCLAGPIDSASALKLSYAGISKGLVTIAATMILAAERRGTGSALREELNASQPELLARFARAVPDMYPKAYRWVDEMRSISEFIGDEFGENQIYLGAAVLYERIARDPAGANVDRDQLDAFFSRPSGHREDPA